MNKYKQLAKELSENFNQHSLYLCELDAKAGDGDHGITISRGFNTAWEKVQALPEDVKGSEVFKTIGYGMLESMGGASGPIFSTFFICMATVLRENEELNGETMKKGIRDTAMSVEDLAGTHRGEKTMVDALFGALDEAEKADDDLNSVLVALAQGAQNGSDATIDMKATKGRAKFMGERSRGFKDAGSQSVVYIMEILKTVFSI